MFAINSLKSLKCLLLALFTCCLFLAGCDHDSSRSRSTPDNVLNPCTDPLGDCEDPDADELPDGPGDDTDPGDDTPDTDDETPDTDDEIETP